MRYDGIVNQANALVGKGHWLCRVVRLAMVGMPEKAPGLVPEVTCWNLMECETVVIVPLPVPFEHPKWRTNDGRYAAFKLIGAIACRYRYECSPDRNSNVAGGDLALTHKKRSARAQLEMHRLYYFLLQKLKEIAMKKTLITLAVLAAATGVAQAQSSVVIYGTVDAGFVSERGGVNGNVNKLDSGVASASRLGFKGTEDLGSGLSALFLLESGFSVDNGQQDVAGTLFNRQAYVGLSSKTTGTLTLGRQYTPWYNTLSKVADPFAAGYAGSAKNLFPSNTRTSNTVLYTSPNFNGFDGDVAYTFGENADSNKIGRKIGASVGYSNGPLNARLAYNNTSNDTATTEAGSGRNWLAAANYDFAVAKAYVAYGVNKGANSANHNNADRFAYSLTQASAAPSIDSNNILVGATVPVGPAGTVMASFIRTNDKTAANADADQWALGYSYALSKRTSTYASYAKIKNKNNAGYTVGNNSNVGTGDKAFNVGVRHSF
ncbi:porin [Janthinobacterium sp. FT14W]|uniref:porin n=1 Tax=Janthinobacterium sp. FT14W TaxID=2654253 RepID=UPI0029CA7044|nr:porin [Janthinobacterium sp. FT14W]